ncbi:hypothetical protein PSH79_11995 [Pseudomonas sp. FP2196]|uniref:hypothetical protein n=1 Tax=Pseudomonas sp. FP2196 TaxID=2954086 RepID=UPI0027333525|nr:hypothetical protein [Pseudomonas sp. FP2196]WLH37984.1 hypothetical protein PSH79_11995 [Pseudomonas sp. FP2196]
MRGILRRRGSLWLLSILIALSLGLSGCSNRKHYPPSGVGDSCYAKALPTVGEGGLAWGSSLNMARQKSMTNCMRYAGRSGGTPNTCQVVLAKCK